ncbi:MAG: D-alanyl-D-alanine carboxypeptidase [Eubacteriales bacterium]|nr:D-alanyl-D-alanine carboxypeptidase [Eubacteriales bacterium]
MKKIIVFILSLSIFAAMPVEIYAKTDEAREIKAKSSILMCMDTGEIINENNAYEHLSPASVTKIMSILLIMEAIDNGKISLNDMVTASENAVSKGGSQIWLEVGEQMSVNDLLKAVIIASANDACTLLGEYIAGSDSGFVDMMNKRAKELGLENTHFENCTGLDDSVTNHYSCAYDLAVIACEVMKHDLVKDYSTIWLDYLRNGKTELNNTNKLINKYNGITGLKTGTTSNAGFCLCATATRDGLSLVSVVLGADTSEDRFNLSVNLLDYGFANYQINKIKIEEKKIKAVKIKNGVVKSVKPAFPDGDSVLVKKGTDNFIYDYRVKEKVEAPVKAGDILGEIVVKCGEKELASVPLTAEKDIKKTTFSYIFGVLFSNI